MEINELEKKASEIVARYEKAKKVFSAHQAEYRNALLSLGGEIKESGNYYDQHSCIEIPGIETKFQDI